MDDKIFRLYIYPNENYEEDLYIKGIEKAKECLEKKIKDIKNQHVICNGMFEEITETKEPYCKIVPIYIKNNDDYSKVEVVLSELDIIT